VQELQFLPAVLSYLIPGLGQIYQGRVGKGILFMSCVYLLFFYGQAMGDWKNVYLVSVSKEQRASYADWVPPVAINLYSRPQFLGQFWVGVAAWPAIWQYNRYDPAVEQDSVLGTFQRAPFEKRAPEGKKQADLDHSEAPFEWNGKTINELQIDGNKTFDLAWVYTVIAGVLNVLIIYDALAGPALAVAHEQVSPKPKEAGA
jgi:hypothetical protein